MTSQTGWLFRCLAIKITFIKKIIKSSILMEGFQSNPALDSVKKVDSLFVMLRFSFHLLLGMGYTRGKKLKFVLDMRS